MKTTIKTIKNIILGLTIGLTGMSAAKAQNQGKPLAVVLGIDSKGIINDATSVSFMVRLEMEKANVYNMMDKYDVQEIISKSDIDLKTCFGKTCAIKAGKILGADKVISGSVERFGEKIVISLKVFDVKTEQVEKQDATEYLNLQPELQKMIMISVQKLLGITPDATIVNLLVNYDTPIESPKTKVNLNGPRMGTLLTFGDASKVLTAPESKGGYNMYPAMFNFGWQKEWQYLSAGDFQALIEFIPMIGGLESGKFIPSVTFMNGFRIGKAGWEFAFGPSFRVVNKSEGFYDKEGTIGEKGEWHLAGEWYGNPNTIDPITNMGIPNPNPIVKRLDSRGSATLSTSLLFGVGRTFKSGYLNIPVNVFCSPRKDGTIVGASFGFNIYKKPKSK